MFSGLTTPGHLLLLLAVIVLLFGAKKLPELARGVGKSARILKAEVSEMNDDAKHPEAKPAPDASESPRSSATSAEKLPDPRERA
ncbi:MAG: Sec-independent protein translocase subunit TatA [Pseudonocardia sp.]|nr:Sec-independent protein translocase subunit TatA [Pseudonocardia sp.]MBO0874078.1 Sec-independent protein translocase subunit TatA [Pseudonocardia sp.]